MIKPSIAAIFILVSSALGARAQINKDLDTVRFNSLPDTLEAVIRANVSSLLVKDTVTGRMEYVKNGHTHAYAYKLFLSNGRLSGIYTYRGGCDNCFSRGDSGYLSARMLYCCKDPAHNPHETAETKAKMEDIQRKDHCSKIGICIID